MSWRQFGFSLAGPGFILLVLPACLQAVRTSIDKLDVQVDLAGSELEVVQAYTPDRHSIDELALSVGDRVKVTHDPWGELDSVAETTEDYPVYGINQKTWESGWFPTSHTTAVDGGSLVETDDASESACKNSFFADWGSSGMKVFRVHTGDAKGDVEKGSEKLTTLTGDTTTSIFENEIVRKCRELHETGNVADHAWRLYATAGLRLHVDNAATLWGHLRNAIATTDPCGPQLAKCNPDTNEGCKTLPGATEALYEMSSYFMTYPDLAPRDHGLASIHAHKRGWMSSGGASLQIGFLGIPAPELRTCISKLNGVWADDNLAGALTYDEMPGMVAYEGDMNAPSLGAAGAVSGRLPDGQSVFLFSFLAVGGEVSTCNDDFSFCDHRVGGVNEMRKQFELFLLARNVHSPEYDEANRATWRYPFNPCLEASAPFPLKYGSDVYSTHLAGGLNPHDEDYQVGQERSMDACMEAAQDFIDSDKTLQAWVDGGCTDLARPIESWGFMTSFTRSTKHLYGVNLAKDPCRKKNNDKKFACGNILTNVLLMRFLDKIGFDSSDTVQIAEKADWALAPMKLFGLKEGWCPVA